MHDPQHSTAQRDDLLAKIVAARAVLENEISGLSEEQLLAPGPDGWSVKDHLAHLASWAQKAIAMSQGRGAHEGLELPADVYRSSSIDEINDLLHARHRDRPLPEVLAYFHASHDELVATVSRLTDADLAGPYTPDDPEDDRWLIDGIVGNSYEHDEEHLGWIREMRAKG